MLKVNIEEKIIEHDINQIIKESELRYGNKYEKPEPLIKYIAGVNEYNYMTYGGVSAVFGKQKSRKTFYLIPIMSAAIGNTVIDDKIRGYTHGKNHLWFDTEQTKYYASMINYRIVRKLELNKHPDNFRLLSIKKYNTQDRIRIIEYMIEKTENIGLVIIDGARDLIKNFNDLDEVTDFINKIMYWNDTYNCHICLVLHINPLKKGDEEKPRGHLGTELQNKVESSVIIEKSKENKALTIIRPRDFRDLDIKTFGLQVDNKGIPELIDYTEDDEIF